MFFGSKPADNIYVVAGARRHTGSRRDTFPTRGKTKIATGNYVIFYPNKLLQQQQNMATIGAER